MTAVSVENKSKNGAGFFVSGKASDDRREGVYLNIHDRLTGGSGRRHKRKRQASPGDYGEGVPPVPIPNTAVKPFSAEYTWS